MKDHRQAPAANYVNWRGRTVRQIGEEAALWDTLVKYLRQYAATVAGKDRRGVRNDLWQFVGTERRGGRLP